MAWLHQPARTVHVDLSRVAALVGADAAWMTVSTPDTAAGPVAGGQVSPHPVVSGAARATAYVAPVRDIW
jgi:hypothetical protein